MAEKKCDILRWQGGVKVCQGAAAAFIYQFFIRLFIIKFLLEICAGQLFCSSALCWTNDAV